MDTIPGALPNPLPMAPAPRRFELKKWGIAFGIAALVLIGGFFVYQAFYGQAIGRKFEEIYMLVPDKISQSAAIVVRLPRGVSVGIAEAGEKFTFSPALKGSWSAGATAEYLIFKPDKKLELDKYYSVALATADVKLQKDFLADKDPKVVSVFPNKDSEASEYSKITIVFNRPMVPLTTLDTLAERDIPVEITPATAGKFKWITTRNLQFIPDSRLVRSAHYTVSIKPGFVSMDNLSVDGATFNFTTRPLRYEKPNIPEQVYGQTQNQMLYDEPIKIIFNQPINIDKTSSELELKKSPGENVPFIASYGTREIYNADAKRYETYTDKSILEIYNKKDRFGREKFWDFNTVYTYILKKAYSAEGDIALDEGRNGFAEVGEIVAGLSAESSRSRHVEPDLFDPEGKLWVEFYEDINKDASQISAKNLKEIGYGEKCREPESGETVPYGDNCEKVADFKRIYITFDPKGLERGQNIDVHFKRITNRDGLKINPEEIVRTIKIYPQLIIFKTIPSEGESGADLTQMKACTSNPLAIPDEQTFYDRIKSNVTVGLWNWHDPYRITSGRQNSPCEVGQFENTISYGLVPEFNYEITLNNIPDDFGQTASKKVRFVSGKLASTARRFTHLQKVYNVTSPERMKFSYAADNLEYVNLNICQVSAENMFRYVQNMPSATTPSSALNCITSIDKKLDLPKKYWSRVHFQVNLADYLSNPIGHYILTFGHPDYRRVHSTYNSKTGEYEEQVGERIYEHTLVTVTNLAVQEKKIQWYDAPNEANRQVVRDALALSPRNLYWVSQFGSLDAVADASITTYQYTSYDYYSEGVRGVQAAGTAQTGQDGIALAKVMPNIAGAIVKKGKDSAIVSENVDRLEWASAAQASERAYIYTDKPIYRPGQQVFIKGLYRLGYDTNYQIFRDRKAEVEIRNSKYEVIATKSLNISDYGTFTTDVTLDANAPLGTYSISSSGWTAYFDVEEYVPAAFQVNVSSDKDEYIAGDTLQLNIDANYYFGVPVAGGTLEYAIAAQDYYFDRYRDGYFQFGAGWYFSYDQPYGDQFILRNKAVVDSHGKARISEPIDFGKFFKGDKGSGSKIFTVNITVKNKNGQSISAQKSAIVHRGEFYAGVAMDNNFVGKNDKIMARFKTVDTQGKEILKSNLAVEVKKITWQSFKRREVDGSYYYQSEEKKDTVQKFTISTDAHGSASKEFSLSDEGEYEVSISGEDQRGNAVRATQDLYVYGSGSVTVRPTNNETLDLATDRGDVNVGDRVKIIIKSPYPKAKALVSLERGTIFEYHVIDVDRNLIDYNFQIKEEYVPNVFVSVLLLSPRPEIKYGRINYRVGTVQKNLSIDIKSNKNNYLPGEKVDLDITAKDNNGNPVSGELSLAVVDLSVLALKGNPKKNPVTFFYDGTPLTVSTESNIKNVLYEADIPVGTKGGSGGGSEELAKKKRGAFKETAYWQGVIHTDSQGRAHVSFILPDNLTTWQAESVGITKDTKVGAGYSEFKTQKDLMIVPLKPRFIVPGDAFSIGGQVFNNTDSLQSINVALTDTSLAKKGTDRMSLALAPRSNQTVYFSVSAPEVMQNGTNSFTLRASAGNLEDTVQDIIPIVRNDTYESVATAAYTNESKSNEYIYLPPNVTPDRGGLTVKTSATLAVFLSDALNYLVEFPYGCSEQIASKLSSLAILKRGLAIKNIGDAFQLNNIQFEGSTYSPDDVVRIGLARLYQNQTAEGGFAYYTNLAPDLYLTLDVLGALIDLKAAGYDSDDRISKASEYVYKQLTQHPELMKNKDLVILASYTLSRAGSPAAANLNARAAAIANDAQYIHEKIGNESLAYLAILLAKEYQAGAKENIFTELENRIVIDARGAYLPIAQGRRLYQFYETPIKDTALMLKAFAADERENAILDKILRWILASRAKDGAWGSTNNTVTVIDALTDFLNWKKENLSSFNLKLSLDQNEIGNFTFDASSILKQFEKFISVKDLGLGKIRTVSFDKTNQNNGPNNYYYDMLLKYYLPIESIPPRDEGFSISREFYASDDVKNSKPLAKAKQGDVVRGHLTIVVPESRNLVAVEDFIPAGMEIVNTNLATEDQTLQSPNQNQNYYYNPYGRNYSDSNLLASVGSFFRDLFNGSIVSVGGTKDMPDDYYGNNQKIVLPLYPDANESHDDRVFLFKQHLEPGVYEFDYYARALVPGEFHHLPATVSELYFPENFGRTRGELFEVMK